MVTNKDPQNFKVIKRIVGFGLLCTAIYTVVWGTGWNRYRRLVNRGKEVSAYVTAKEPTNHSAVRYSYVINQQTYKSIGRAGHGNPGFDDLNLGDSVRAYYDPASPDVSCLGNPGDYFRDSNVAIAFTVVGIMVALLVASLRGRL